MRTGQGKDEFFEEATDTAVTHRRRMPCGLHEVRIEGEILSVPKSFSAVIETAKHIDFYINSPGGNCGAAFLMLEKLRRNKVKTTAHIQFAASAAAILAVGCDYRRIAPTGGLMLHPTSSCEMGTAAELRARADDLDQTNRRVVAMFVEQTNWSRRAVEDWFSGPSFYFNAKESLKLNLVHNIDSAARSEEKVETLPAGDAEVPKAACDS